MVLKQNDFVEFTYTGMFKDGEIFDTTDEETAKKNHLYNTEMKYGPKVCILGKGVFLKGLEEALIGKETGKHHIELPAEKAFGQPNPKLRQLLSTGQFRKQNINPRPGLQVNIDGAVGLVRTVSGGRTLVDFNHPFAGKDVSYDITVQKVITDTKEKADAIIQILQIDARATVENEKITLTIKKEIGKKEEEFIIKELKELTGKETEIKVEKTEEGSKK